MDQQTKNILEKLFLASIAGSKGVKAKQFRAQNYKYLDTLDKLESTQYIEVIDKLKGSVTTKNYLYLTFCSRPSSNNPLFKIKRVTAL